MPTLPLIALAYVVGAVLAATLGGAWWLTATLTTLASVALALHVTPRPSALVLVAAIAFATLAHVRTDVTLHALRPHLAGTHELTAVAIEDTTLSGSVARTELELRTLDGAPAHGRILMTVHVGSATALPAAHDLIALSGDLKPAASESFRNDAIVSPRRWRVTGHESQPRLFETLARVRAWSLANIERSLPEPHASLAAGVLLGEQRTMPPSLTSALRTTGTTHLVVVSGQNIAIVLGATVALLSAWISRRRAALLALCVVLPCYVILVGGSPPVLRAALMSVGIVIAALLGRRTPAWIFLSYAAAGMLAWDPSLVTSVSFQLSAAATAGVLLLAPPLTELAVAPLLTRTWGRGLLAGLVEAAVIAIAAAIAVLPVQAAAFGNVSIVQVPANALVALSYEGTLVVATIAALTGWLAPIAAVLHIVATPVPAAFIATVEAFARIPSASLPLHLTPVFVVAWYTVVGALLWYAQRRARAAQGTQVLSVRAALPVRTIALAIVAVVLWLLVLTPVDDLASVTVLDVGQGLAVLVRDGGSSVLVDAGPPDGAVLAALARAGQRTLLDALVLTHNDTDHTGGTTEVLRRIGAQHVLAAPRVSAKLAPGLEAIDIGDRITLSPRVSIEVLAPAAHTTPATLDSDNNLGLVLMVEVGGRRILLPADIEAPTEQWLTANGTRLHADVIVVPHHGSTTSSMPAFLHAVAPSIAVISVGARNSYGHPAPAVLERYASTPVHRTDQVGDVTLRTDGQHLWVRDAHAATEGATPRPRATVTATPKR
ncbi:MAG: DNA internalization-related competence protein ComEC/Rec2 [Chloroflexota bacterium]